LATFYPSVLQAPKKATCEPELAPVQAPFSIVENTRQATVNDYLVHHDPEYISALISLEELEAKNQDKVVGEEEKQDQWQMLEEFGLIDDCHIYSGLASRLSYMTGATLLAAELICSGQARIAVHWEGGR
jgi:histone deacetylase 8